MTPNVAIRQIRSSLDWAFIVGVVFALVLADKIVPFLIVVGVAPIPFLLGALKERRLVVSRSRLLIPAAIYFTYALLTLFLFTGLMPGEPKPINPGLELYAIAIAMLLVGLVRGVEIERLRARFDVAVPWTLLFSFVVLSVMMFFGYRTGCRVQAGAAWPFIPALLFGTLTFLSFIGWKDLSKQGRYFRLLLNALAIVVTIAYTASRGIGVAQFCVLGILALISLLPKFRGELPSFLQIALSGIIGLVLCGLVSITTGCGAMERIVPMIKTLDILSAHAAEQPAQPVQAPPQGSSTGTSVQMPAMSAGAAAETKSVTETAIMDADASIGVRLEMWKTSLQAIAEAPLFGHGSLYLQHLITQRYGFEHNHNQYLSWLVTGGVFGLAIGLLFLAIPWIVSAGLSTPDRLIITLAVSIFWGFSMMFDSYFNLKFYTHYYCLLCGLLYALVNDTLVGEAPPEGTR